VAGELLQGRTEAGEVKIDTANAGLLELRNAGSDGASHQRLDILPVVGRAGGHWG
jgi:hypothetical protein